MKTTKRIVLFPVALLMMSGCGLLTTPQKSEYTDFAQAGSKYAAAVDQLLVAAGETQVDATSWILVKDKKNRGSVTDATYQQKTKDDIELLALIARLREHAWLLSRYFDKLESLATSDAPERTKGAMEGVVKGINDLSKELNTSYPKVINALPPLTNIVVDAKIRGALREELDKRKDILRKELQIQGALVAALQGQIAHALELAQDIKEHELVRAPLQTPCPQEKTPCPLDKPEDWVAKRHEVVYMATTVKEINSAVKAANEMGAAFEALLSGEQTTGRINALIADIERILAVTGTIHKQ